jgi:hypothetical protein
VGRFNATHPEDAKQSASEFISFTGMMQGLEQPFVIMRNPV